MSETIWMCPVCGAPLAWDARTLRCPARHSFDAARSGYVHLLPASRKRSAVPGDDPEMVRSRRRFLENGHYAHLLETLQDAAAALPQGAVLLDAGCGEGWYTKGIHAARPDLTVFGIDISKTAADLAARADKSAAYAVASVFHMPVQTASCDAVMSVFAPYCGEEFRRVLRPGGRLILAVPAARHLWELKCAVYEHPYENELHDTALEGFKFLEKRETSRMISLDTPQAIADLFGMTPYAYRTSPADRARLDALTSLETLAAFEVLVYEKEDAPCAAP